MDLKLIRRNLLLQHENLRNLMNAVESVLEKGNREEIDRRVRVLRDACQSHNAAEEATLVPILESIDAWGTERVKQLLADHAHEHSLLLSRLEVSAEPRAIRETLKDLRAHMSQEEESTFAETVLKDDVVNVDAD